MLIRVGTVPFVLLVLAGGALAQLPPSVPSSVESGVVQLPAAGVDWLLVGGGFDPLSNQISLAQDIDLARSLLGGAGAVLFAGGAFAPLAVLDPEDRKTSLHAVLARLFAPQSAGIRFESRREGVSSPATTTHVLEVLERSLARGTGPLLVYVATHGDRGEEPAQSSLSLWGGWPLSVSDVAVLLDRSDVRRSARFVVTSCYGGGFAEIIFPGAQAGRRSRDQVHCGLFAAPWDDEASGCDPNPDRRAQESYGLHFLNALAGRGRNGTPLPTSILDFDGDGRIGLLDAHTQARLASRSIDIPTTTSERWLRVTANSEPAPGTLPPAAVLPEERVVIERLGSELGIETEDDARRRLRRVDEELDRRHAELEDLTVELDDAWASLRIALLERWPELDQPWSPIFEERLRSDGEQIMKMATTSLLARRHAALEAESEARWERLDEVRIDRARLLRVARAFETLDLAARLAAKGGAPWEVFRSLRSCERWAPAVRDEPHPRAAPLPSRAAN